jgi:hypothetical protein
VKERIQRIPIQEITAGQVVRGGDGQWWRVLSTDVDITTKTVVLHTELDSPPHREGSLQGAIGDPRDIRR